MVSGIKTAFSDVGDRLPALGSTGRTAPRGGRTAPRGANRPTVPELQKRGFLPQNLIFFILLHSSYQKTRKMRFYI